MRGERDPGLNPGPLVTTTAATTIVIAETDVIGAVGERECGPSVA